MIYDTSITVICDNNPYKQGLQTDWGFSCLITGVEKTILFDTGPAAFSVGNMGKLAAEPRAIDTVVLSHIHGDHTGGLNSFLQKNSDVTVYLPESFPQKFKDNVKGHGAKIVDVKQPLKICEDVYSTGQVGGWIKEQSLIIRTSKGLVIITGCAHPGIMKIVDAAKNLMKSGLQQGCPDEDDILLPAPVVPAQVTQAQVVMGGFHLEWMTKGKIEKIISSFKQMGVQKVGPGHCTGEKARALFEKHFGGNYINVGAGKTIPMKIGMADSR